MTFTVLAAISFAAILGPLLAVPVRFHLPVVVGELIVGIALGPTGSGQLHSGNVTFTFLANIGFALVMFVAGSHVPVRDPRVRDALTTGASRAVVVAGLSIPLGFGLARAFGTGHGLLYGVLMSSSSAALVLPIVGSLRLGGEPVLELLAQVAIADTACIVALPLAIDPGHAGRAALGAATVLSCAAALFVILRRVERNGLRKRVHRISEERGFALELRVNLGILFALAALAQRTHVSIMLAGFSFGMAVAGVGEPRRLARQLFAVTEGFLGPLFFVWLGSSLDLHDLGKDPSLIGLGVLLGAGAALSHAALRLTGQPLSLGGLAAAQLGLPVAAATLGTQLRLLQPGEAAALVLGALVTIAWATASGAWAVRAGLTEPASSGPAASPPPAAAQPPGEPADP
jgi:Kef-type K+ transport system membrane component KefB